MKTTSKKLQKRRKNPAAINPPKISAEDLFRVAGSSIGWMLGGELAKLAARPSRPKPFKPSAVIALRMHGVCIHCSHWDSFLSKPFVEPGMRRLVERVCPMCRRKHSKGAQQQ